eukprot:2812678-Prymnesium_polylepis.1
MCIRDRRIPVARARPRRGVAGAQDDLCDAGAAGRVHHVRLHPRHPGAVQLWAGERAAAPRGSHERARPTEQMLAPQHARWQARLSKLSIGAARAKACQTAPHRAPRHGALCWRLFVASVAAPDLREGALRPLCCGV